jgi:hypothetical protein
MEAKVFHAKRQMDRRNEVNGRFSQFCERAYTWHKTGDVS